MTDKGFLRMPDMHAKTRTCLGIVGLIPFVGLTLTALLGSSPSSYLLALVGYGAIILSFLAGSLWGQLLSTHNPVGLVVTNLLALGAWAALGLALAGWHSSALLGLSLGFLACLHGERQWLEQSNEYRRLRKNLTLAVIACQLTALWA